MIMDSMLQTFPYFQSPALEAADQIENRNTAINSVDGPHNTTIFNDLFNTFDRSNLCDIDPDINYLSSNDFSVENNYYTENEFNSTYANNNNFSIFLLNMRSLPEHFNELTAYLDCLNFKFKILALTETWLKDYHSNYSIQYYNFEQDLRPRMRGGGVSLYLHNQLQYKKRNDLKIIPNIDKNGEAKPCHSSTNIKGGKEINSIFVEIEKHSAGSSRNIIVGCLYRPPCFPIREFNKLISDLLDKLEHENKSIYLTGDFNCNIQLCTPAIEEFKNNFTSYHFYPLINKPTRITESTSTLIDNIYCNVPNVSNNIQCGLLHVNISDHKGLFCINSSATLPDTNITTVKRNMNQKNISLFNSSLGRESWQFIYDNNTQNAFTRFQGVLDQHFDKNFQMQTCTMTYKNRLPWMTNQLRQHIINKNKMYLKTIENPRNNDLTKDYKKKKNELNSLLRNSEISYYSNQLETHKNDISKSWKILKTIIGKDNRKVKKLVTFCINNKMVSNSNEIANCFNDFFVSIGPTLAKDIQSTINPMSYIDNTINSIVILNVSPEEVRKVISSLKHSSPGWDQMPAFILKKCVNNYIKPLTHIINSSLKEGIFPNELKLARVVPIFKSGDSTKITNYRPISVLTFFSKIFERIVYNYITAFMNEHNVIYKYQFGFREKHSTQQAIICLVEKITHSLDSGDIVIGIFLDLKKAFDTVNHRILLNKLYAYGIRGNILKWFRSYLTDRLQYVTYDDSKSTTRSLTCGVPQGSILGPLLFIIYMNDICNVSTLLYTVLFADDTSVLMKGKNINSLIQQLNTELNLLSDWLRANKLSLNADKTFYLIFHRARLKMDSTPNVIMNNCTLNVTSQLKYLGVIIDNKLNWHQHITYVKNKISKGIGIMYKARPYLDKHCLANLYHTYIYPYLIYCIEIWGNVPHCHLNPLLLLQKKIIRIITFSNYLAHTEPIFKELNILPIHKLYFNRIGILMYKYTTGLLPEVMNELYTQVNEIHDYNTRNANKFHISSVTDTFSSISARIWNALSDKIDVNVCFARFKVLFKSYLLNNCLQIKYTK